MCDCMESILGAVWVSCELNAAHAAADTLGLDLGGREYVVWLGPVSPKIVKSHL